MSNRIISFIVPLVPLLVICISFPVSAAERVAVLTNGNVLTGEIKQQVDQVIITTGNSEIRLSAAEVEVVKPNLIAAYRAKSAAIPGWSNRARSQLIRWCLQHDLRPEARQQLELMRRFEPDWPELDSLQKQINSFRRPRRNVIPPKSSTHQDEQFAKKHLDRLSKQTIADFVHSVQPLMINRCGQASCHGRVALSSFSLVSSPLSRVPRNITLRNLGATLRRIGNYPSEQTLLWMSARSLHGAMIANPLSELELEKLLAWIRRVNSDLGVADDRTRAATTAASIPVGEEVDPFDPANFNQQLPAGFAQ